MGPQLLLQKEPPEENFEKSSGPFPASGELEMTVVDKRGSRLRTEPDLHFPPLFPSPPAAPGARCA